jgi:uncharacterized delta-60 repeat protein
MKAQVRIYRTMFIVLVNMFLHDTIGQTNTFKVLTDLGSRGDYAYSIAIQGDGKVVVAGDAGGTPCMVRFDTTGYLDYTFGSEGKVFASWNCGSNPADNEIKIQTDGKIVIGTRISNGADEDFIVARYHVDGTPDMSFGENGRVISPIGSYDDWCNSIAIQPDGKILAGGSTAIPPAGEFMYDFALMRYNSDGTIDHSFGNDGIVTTHIGSSYNIAYSIVIQENGKIVLAGEARDSDFSDFAVARYNPDGSLDNSFGNGGVVRTALSETYDYAKSVILQADQKILVAGSAQSSLYNLNCALVRYDTTGMLDSTFGTNGVVITDIDNETGNSVAILPDNKIILGGSYTNSTVWSFAAFRYNADGSPDQTFGTSGMITASFGNGDSEGNAVAIGDDGEILIAGSFNHGSPDYFDFALLRLFSNLLPDAVPRLLSPPNGSSEESVNLAFTWNSVLDASGYHLQVSTSPDFDTTAIDETGILTTFQDAYGLSNNTTYYWRVSATVAEIERAWSETWNFSTAENTIDIHGIKTEKIKLVPIPARDKILIHGIENEMTTISIQSVDGKLMKQLHGSGIKEIDLRDLRNGIYILSISNSRIDCTKRILKL